MSTKIGKLAAVYYGSDKVAEMGTWSLDGITVDMVEDTQFRDEFKTYLMGLGDYGTVSFSGWWDMSDTSGQALLDSALRNKSKLINIKFYVDNTSYYTPNTNVTSSGGNADAGMWVQSMKITFDKAGIGQIDFSGKLTGPMILM